MKINKDNTTVNLQIGEQVTLHVFYEKFCRILYWISLIVD